LFLRTYSYYEKIDHCYFCALGARDDAGLLFEPTRVDYDYNASDYCNCAATTRRYDNNNDASEHRLLSRSG